MARDRQNIQVSVVRQTTEVEPFIMAYKNILRSTRLSTFDKWILLALIDRQKTGNWPVSYSQLGKDVGGIGRTSVFYSVTRLVKLGLVKQIKKLGNGNVYKVDMVRLVVFMTRTPGVHQMNTSRSRREHIQDKDVKTTSSDRQIFVIKDSTNGYLKRDEVDVPTERSVRTSLDSEDSL